MVAAQDTARHEAIQHAAERLRHADSMRWPCDSIGDLIGDDLATAYAVQRLVTELQMIGGAAPSGRKLLGLADTFGGPLVVAGTLVDTMAMQDDAQLTGRELVQPRIAVRLTARLVRDVEAGSDVEAVRAAVGAVGVALEIADLRVSADQATAIDIVADNAGAGRIVFGPEWAPRETSGPWRARVLVDGLPSGAAAEATWVDTVARLAQLAIVVTDQGHPLRAGEIILLDSFGSAAPLSGNGRYAAEVDGRVVASIRFGSPTMASPEEAS